MHPMHIITIIITTTIIIITIIVVILILIVIIAEVPISLQQLLLEGTRFSFNYDDT